MKRIGLLFAALAAGKVGTIEYLQRAATRDALVTAYGKDAVAACQKATQADALKAGPVWRASTAVRLEVGNRQSAVALWQVDHQDWQARFRRTYIVLDAGTSRCRFDIANGAATVADM